METCPRCDRGELSKLNQPYEKAFGACHTCIAEALALTVAGSQTARQPVEHKLKTHPEFFKAIVSGKKTFDVRNCSDRDFRVTDKLIFEEYDPGQEAYSGRSVTKTIVYMQTFGIEKGFVALGLA